MLKYSPSFRCGGFSYDKNTYNCTIIGIPEAMMFIPEDAVKVIHSDSEAYFHKVKTLEIKKIVVVEITKLYFFFKNCGGHKSFLWDH